MDYEKKIYDDRAGQTESMYELRGNATYSKHILGLLKGKLLDVGCGAGSLTGWLKKHKKSLDVYGVDFSKSAIKIARKRFASIHFLACNIYKLPFTENYFDSVVMSHVLEHLENPGRALDEICRVIKKNGIFFSITPMENETFVIKPPKKLSEKYFGHLQQFNRRSLIALYKEKGFVVDDYYYKGLIIQGLINVIHIYLYTILKLPQTFSLDNTYLRRKRKADIKDYIISTFRKIVFYLIIIDSRFSFKRIPGASICIIAHKK